MIGTMLQNRYRIDAELGHGGMGTVYRAHDILLDRDVAVKLLSRSATGLGAEGRARLLHEARAVARLNHPNIVAVYDAGETGDTPFIVIELVAGETLRQIPTPALADALTYARQICAALAHAHSQGIIHRDLKLENVIVLPSPTTGEGSGMRVKLMDFGLAWSGNAPRLTQEGALLGTVAYLAPELITGGAASPQSDLYALGVMLYELLTGRPPFEGSDPVLVLGQHLHAPVTPPRMHNPAIPPDVDALVVRLLSKQPGERPASAGEVFTALGGTELNIMIGLTARPKHNLPTQLSTFIGREKEIAQVKERLTVHRLVTLTGSGGIGKTRLAIQVGREVLPLFSHGVWLIELAPLARPELVPGAVATVLGVRDSPERPVLDALTDYLREKNALLVLDNCEHLIDVCAQLAEHLLRHCPEVRILASSREALGIEGETATRVPSLTLPPASSASRETLEQSEAVRLFVERAAAALPGFELTDANAPALVQVCRRLDGVPLAIELAAARVKLLKVEQIAARLDDAFRLLTGGSRTALPRQQTLRATIDWSYNLLSEAERTLLRRLSVFAGGWTLEAAEAVCAGDGIAIGDVLELLTQLVLKSLATVEQEQDEAVRYYLLETTRQYAREKLAESGEGQAVRGKHLDYYVELAERLELRLRTSERMARWKQALAEYDNVRAALEWSFAEARTMQVEKGLRLASALEELWIADARTSIEGTNWLQQGLALLARDGTPESTLVRAKALKTAGRFALYQGMDEAARAMLEESVTLYRALNLTDKRDLVLALNQLAFAWRDADLPTAHTLTEEGVAIGRELGSSGRWHLATALWFNGNVAYRQRDYAAARSRCQEGLALFRQVSDSYMTAVTIHLLGWIADCQGDPVAARSLYQEALREFQLMDSKFEVMWVTESIAQLDYTTGDYESARARFEETLLYCRDTGDNFGASLSLRELGTTRLRLGDYKQATRLLRESLLLIQGMQTDRFASMGLSAWAEILQVRGEWFRAAVLLGSIESEANRPGNWWSTLRADYDKTLANTREALSEEAFAAAMAQGRAMTIQQAIAYALDQSQPDQPIIGQEEK